jgi:hypothetical protein
MCVFTFGRQTSIHTGDKRLYIRETNEVPVYLSPLCAFKYQTNLYAQMFAKAEDLGIDAYGGSRQGMYLVRCLV